MFEALGMMWSAVQLQYRVTPCSVWVDWMLTIIAVQLCDVRRGRWLWTVSGRWPGRGGSSGSSGGWWRVSSLCPLCRRIVSHCDRARPGGRRAAAVPWPRGAAARPTTPFQTDTRRVGHLSPDTVRAHACSFSQSGPSPVVFRARPSSRRWLVR